MAKLRRHVRILVELGRLASENHSLERFLDGAVLHVARAVEIDHVKVLRYRRRTADLLMEAGMGWKEGLVRSAVFPSDLGSPAGRTFQTGEPTIIEDLGAAEGEYTIPEMLKEHGIVSLANVPVLIDGAAWGVLEVDSSKHRTFSEDTIAFLRAAAAILAPFVRRRMADRDEAQAVAQAQAREVLLTEMQHRVKNNFQLILAAISFQKRRFADADAHRALDHVANRINAISLAHDQLSPRQDMHAVDVASYLNALCASMGDPGEDVSIDVEADEVELPIDRAVPLGLIVNEAVTNSVKHAFGEGGGRVSVRLISGVGYGEARLTIADNGRGIQAPRPGGSGQKLIAALARQMGGEFAQESSDEGTTTTVTFPVVA